MALSHLKPEKVAREEIKENTCPNDAAADVCLKSLSQSLSLQRATSALMFIQLKIFAELTQGDRFALTEAELCVALRLRGLCSVEDWAGAVRMNAKARRVAELHTTGWIPEEVAQIYGGACLYISVFVHLCAHAYL